MDGSDLDLLVKLGIGALLGTVFGSVITATAQVAVAKISTRNDSQKERRARELELLDAAARSFESVHGGLRTQLDRIARDSGSKEPSAHRAIDEFSTLGAELLALKARLILVGAKEPAAAIESYLSALGHFLRTALDDLPTGPDEMVNLCARVGADLASRRDGVLASFAAHYQKLWS